jgi:hypothetical protein
MDPGTPSGHSLRTSMSDFGSGSPAIASGSAGGGGGASSSVTPQESDASDSVDSRWASAVSRLSAPHRVMAAGTAAAMSSAGPVLEAAGVGAGTDGAGQGSNRPARSGGQPTSARGSSTRSAPNVGPDGGPDSPPPALDVPGPPDGGPG